MSFHEGSRFQERAEDERARLRNELANAATDHTVGCECGHDTTFPTPVTGPWACEACGRRYIGPLPSNAEERERRARARDVVDLRSAGQALRNALLGKLARHERSREIEDWDRVAGAHDNAANVARHTPEPTPQDALRAEYASRFTAADWNDADRKR